MGRKFTAVLVRLGMPTGDKRLIAPGALTNRELPLPLLWQETTDEGHGGAVVVAVIQTLDYGDPSMVRATGELLTEQAWKVEELIESGVIGPSVDLDDVDYVMDESEQIVITQGRIAGATLVAIPAFAEVSIDLQPYEEPAPDAIKVVSEEEYDFLYASASSLPFPPADWFEAPSFAGITPLTVTDDGRVFGHIAPWGQCHVGMPGCVTAPASQTEYSYFHQGAQRLADGSDLPVGTLTVGGGHAAPGKGWAAAIEHYDNVGAAVAKVRAGEDEHGIWVSGWLLPQATEEQREAFRSSPVSGDWRQVGGNLELVAICSVNSAGFPVPRARVSFSHDGGQRSLVASFGVTPVKAPEVRIPSPSAKEARARWAWFEANQKGR